MNVIERDGRMIKSHTTLIGILEGERRENEEEAIFRKILAKNFPV